MLLESCITTAFKKHGKMRRMYAGVKPSTRGLASFKIAVLRLDLQISFFIIVQNRFLLFSLYISYCCFRLKNISLYLDIVNSEDDGDDWWLMMMIMMMYVYSIALHFSSIKLYINYNIKIHTSRITNTLFSVDLSSLLSLASSKKRPIPSRCCLSWSSCGSFLLWWF